MAVVADTLDNQSALPVSAALCVDREAFDRFGRVLRHLLVGLIDQAVKLRLVSSDPRVEKLTLGPVQTVVHERIGWPMTRRRIDQLVDVLSYQPPTLVHALSSASYKIGITIAEAFDADIALQVTSVADCDAIANLKTEPRPLGSGPTVKPARRFLALSRPLVTMLEEQLKIPAEWVDLIHPGVLTSQRIACFADAKRTPTILCLSALERGSRVDRLIEAVDLVRKRDHTVLLFLLGQGRQESALRRMIRERKLSSCVTLAHPAGDPSQAMHSADIFVRPSADTAFTTDGLQAMGAGMAVVTFPNTVCDYLHHGETAVICEKPTAESLANTLEQLLTDRAGAQRIATTAIEYVRTHHAVSGMAERTANAYRKLALARATFSIKE
ncbi:MAG: glycosyltransferase family 4 protein [Phycisphaerae bacterium]